MRNLKKILALVLALVMSMSLVVTANAAFTDEDDITAKYDEAVQVLSGLEVFQGFNDGSFQPQGTINRAQVAAIIYRIVTGDVDDEQVSIYADWNRFPDVTSDAWYAGYVNFCANGKYIKGYSNGNFGPTDPVTGYQALAMILRAIGYDQNGEFTGSDWAVKTATTAKARHITDNITEGTLSQAATRETVAEILFRAIVVNQVEYTLAYGYTEGTTSLGYDTFGLTAIDGVVTANEWASLTANSPLSEGRTTIGGTTYKYSTDLTDLGESVVGWADKTKTVLYYADSGLNTVAETGAKQSKFATFAKTEGISDISEAEKFLNFATSTEYKASDYKLKYVLVFSSVLSDTAKADYTVLVDGADKGAWDDANTDAAGATYSTYTRAIEPGKVIYDQDIDNMKHIFKVADLLDESIVDGEVYVGTQSNTDISDTLSYKDFAAKYIITDTDSTNFTTTVNGDWLKIIDNDGDGVAEYIFKTVSTITDVAKVAKDGTVTLASQDNDADALAPNTLDEDTDIVVVDDCELNVGDVVLYAVIDGVAYADLADTETATIDKVDRTNLTATSTDGTEYVQSGVHGTAYMASSLYQEGVTNLAGSTSYDLYFDAFGYLTVFTESAKTGDYTLIVDGYYNQAKAADEYAVRAYQDGSLNVVDTTIASSTKFITTNGTANNAWGAMKLLGGATGALNGDVNSLRTTVVSLSDSGVLTPVDSVFNKKVVRMIALDGNTVINDNNYHTGYVYTTGTTAATTTAYDTLDAATRNADGTLPTDRNAGVNGEAEVRALTTTVFYYVYKTGNTFVVDTYTGINNAPNVDASNVQDVYAVATKVDRVSSLGDEIYYTADVVVVELNGEYNGSAEEVFVYDSAVVGSNVTIDQVSMIREDGTDETVSIDITKSTNINWTYGSAGSKHVAPGLYKMYETDTENVYKLTALTAEEIRDGKYTVGQVSTTYGTGANNYTEITAFCNGTDVDGASTVTAAAVTRGDANNDVSALVGYPYASASADTPEYQILDSSKLYTLSYAWNTGDAHDYAHANATLSEDDYTTVLAEGTDGSRTVTREFVNPQAGGISYNWNDVLVKYDTKGNIVYAVSFANIYSTNTNDNFAQNVWHSILPAAAATSSVEVRFYGVPAAANTTTTVSYSDALGEIGLVVTGGKANITVPDAPVAAGATYNLTVYGNDGNFYNYTLVQSPARDNANLYVKATDTVAADADLALPTAPSVATIEEYVNQYTVKDGATVTWSFETYLGTTFSFTGFTPANVPTGVTTDEIEYVTATVSAENGNTVILQNTGTSATNDLNTFVTPLTASVGDYNLYGVGGRWLDQTYTSAAVTQAFRDVAAASTQADKATAEATAELQILVAVAQDMYNNMPRLFNGGTGTDLSFIGSVGWNSATANAYNTAYTAVQTALTGVNAGTKTPTQGMTEIINAWNTFHSDVLAHRDD
jgi:hypothetical protein